MTIVREWYEDYVIEIKPDYEVFASTNEYADGWYFIDEAYNYHGPYETREKAVEEVQKYARWLNGQD